MTKGKPTLPIRERLLEPYKINDFKPGTLGYHRLCFCYNPPQYQVTTYRKDGRKMLRALCKNHAMKYDKKNP